ncbi:MAG: carbonic anhydrase [Bdellovibrio sp.]|jgi:carbonic anhydrase
MNSAVFKLILLSLVFANMSCALTTRNRERPMAPESETAVATPAEPPATPTAPAEVPFAQTEASTSLDDGPSIQLKKINPIPEGKKRAILIGVSAAAPDVTEANVSTAGTSTPAPTTADTSNVATTAAAVEAATAPRPKVVNVEPTKALKWLQNGNRRYVKGFLRKDGQSRADRKRTMNGQKPHAVIFASSDSRLSPELVFDQKLGEIFVVRTQGLALDSATLGSIESAAQDLGVRLIIVMGNTSSEVVRAAMSTEVGYDFGSPSMNHVISEVQDRLRDVIGSKPSSDDFSLESWLNTRRAASDLVKRSAMLEASAKNGQIVIRSAMYHLDSGVVEFE